MNSTEIIADLRTKRTEARNEMDRILATAEKFSRSLSSGQQARFESLDSEIRGYDSRITELEDQVRQDTQVSTMARAYGPASTSRGRDESVYRPDRDQSFFRDLYTARSGDWNAQDRLRRNNEQRAIAGDASAKGTELVPPRWLEEEFIAVARPGRITADLCARQDMPSGTDSINIPVINTGTQVAAQATQNTGVQQTDLTTSSKASPVITVAGGQTVSLQLIEQSPINIDNVVLSDLAADYARQLNAYVLAGTGTNGQFTGITTTSGIHAVDFPKPSGAPSMTGPGGLYGTLANAIQEIHSSRFAPADCIVMHPRRWQWCMAQEDNQNRPLVVPNAMAYNAMGVQAGTAAQGHVGTMLGLPVFLDAGIPTTGTADSGTGEDYILVMRSQDNMLFESQIKAEAFQQTYAQNMSVFVRLYAYSAFVPRYANSIALVTGSGLAAPTF